MVRCALPRRTLTLAVYRTQSVLKYLGPKRGLDNTGLPSCTLNKSVAKTFLREALTVKQLRIEIWSQDKKAWRLERRASPGNLQAVEDLLFSDDNLYSAPVAMAVTFKIKANVKTVGAAFVDTSSREIGVAEFEDGDLFPHFESLLIQLGVKEVILPSDGKEADYETTKLKSVLERCGVVLSGQKRADFSDKSTESDLIRLLKGDIVSGTMKEVDLKQAMAALGGLIAYLGLLADTSNHAAFVMRRHELGQHMCLDASALRALHLMPETTGFGAARSNSSVFGLLNKCKTSQGVRLLAQWLKQPLVNLHMIRERQDLVEAFFDDMSSREALRETLARMPDFARLCKRFKRGQANLQDVVRVYQAILRLPHIINCLANLEMADDRVDRVRAIVDRKFLDSLRTLNDDLAKFVELVETTVDLEELDRHNYVIKPEYDAPGLGKIRAKLDQLKEDISEEHARVAEDLGMEVEGKTPLHLEDDKTYGYSFRLTRKESTAIRGKKAYTELSTKAAGVTFTTKVMRTLSEQYKDQTARYSRQQSALVKQVLDVAATYVALAEDLNGQTAELDVISDLAHIAANSAKPYVRPVVREKGEGNLHLEEARHPCLEVQDDIDFIPNDVSMVRGEHELSIITGPNMGGKSVYLRMTGCIALMAQIGSFVPCTSAELPAFDAILARVGAGDSMLRGLSTFMAEMTEMSAILKTATSDSLVIIDELGRGTSTYDGFGLAWSIAEHIATEIKAFTLFASHFHELKDLSEHVPTVKNLHVQAHVERNEKAITGKDVVLLYKVADGACDASYGINVAELAHFPPEVIKLAKRKAEIFEDFGTDDADAAEPVDEATATAGIDLVSGIVRDWAKRRKLDDGAMDVDGSAVDVRATFDSLKAEFEKNRSTLESNAWVQKVLLA